MDGRKVAIVTAGGRGMGAAMEEGSTQTVARALAARDHALVLMSPGGSAEALAAEVGAIGVNGSVPDPKTSKRWSPPRWTPMAGSTPWPTTPVSQSPAAAGERPLGIPTIRDRVVQGAVKLVIEPIFEADLEPSAYGYRPKRSAGKGPLLEIPDEDWHDGLDMVLMNVIRMARLVTPIMAGQGGGAIVNISTYAAVEPSPAYPVSATFRLRDAPAGPGCGSHKSYLPQKS